MQNDKTLEPGQPEDEDYEADIIELEDDEGKTHPFEVIDATDIGQQRYFMLSPCEEESDAANPPEEGSFIIMKLCKDDEGEYLEVVEDSEELQSAVQVFSTRLEDLFNIELD